ncbi:MAG TPA: NAD(P)-binding protein [Myxococcota bacterium]|nr:NAD(P)-binding protein [Myxococcota bacterium]
MDPEPSRRSAAPRILVLGGGFAGLAAALALAPARRVTLIDRRPHFEFLPNIHELVSGVKTPALLRLPLRAILARRGHRFLRGEIRRIDLAARRVVLAAAERSPGTPSSWRSAA